MIRSWLAAVIRLECPASPAAGDANPAELLRVAQEEGVVALVHERLQWPELASLVLPGLREAFAEAALEKAVQSLLRQAECRCILERLERAGLPVLLLKGSALAYWLYASPHLRDCSDIDFLFATREDTDHAAEILVENGYAVPAIAGDLVTYERTAYRAKDTATYLEADLHWGVGGAPVYGDRLRFEELHAESIPLPALAPNARGLGPVHAYVHAAIHRALQLWQGTGNRLKWLLDLHLLGGRFTEKDWEDLLSVCAERGLCGTCLDGLRGAADAFHTRVPEGVVELLEQGSRHEPLDLGRMGNWGYIQRMNLGALPTPGLKFRWLRQRLLPSAGFLRHQYGEAGGKRGALGRYLRKGWRNLRG